MTETSRRAPRVHQVLATLGYGDAIGHEVLGIRRVLRRAGIASEIYVETADPRLEDLTLDYREMVGAIEPHDIMIHHFSIGSRASRTAYALPGRMALVYHNITPPEYFVGIHKDLVKLCFHGRRELTAYVSRCNLALGDSEYNRQELQALGFSNTDVLPVVPDFSHLAVSGDHADRTFGTRFDDGITNVMFVGRVIPNKKIEDVIRAFHLYRTRFNPRSRLLLVGSYGGFERYLAMLHALVARLSTPDVHFLGHVSNEELSALYDVADVFLCASEHEGFCVPLMEAFHKRVPVLAYAATAVPATMDGGGVLYDTKDPYEVARLIDAIVDDPRIEEAVLDSQDAALDRLQGRDFGATLLRFVDGIAQRPPRPAPEISWDFWAQFDQFERLEELRQFRPALYRALPTESALGDRRSGPGSADGEAPQPQAHDSRAPGAERCPPNAERRAPTAEPRAPSPESRPPSAERRR
jgi:glycosyltransferase involved in cell wall biosynthesis